MTDARTFLGYPTEFLNLCLVYPPKVKDVVGNKDYGVFLKLITISQEEIDDEFVKQSQTNKLERTLTPFEYILNLSYNNPEVKTKIEMAFQLFIHEPIMPLYEQKQILIGGIQGASLENWRVLTEENYFEFQNIVRLVCGLKIVEKYDPDENPRIREMKAKARLRDKIKAQKGLGLNLETTLSSICCMNMGLNPLNIGELSYAALNNLIGIYQQKEKYELDISSLLAGADSKKIKPKYWIANLKD